MVRRSRFWFTLVRRWGFRLALVGRRGFGLAFVRRRRCLVLRNHRCRALVPCRVIVWWRRAALVDKLLIVAALRLPFSVFQGFSATAHANGGGGGGGGMGVVAVAMQRTTLLGGPASAGQASRAILSRWMVWMEQHLEAGSCLPAGASGNGNAGPCPTWARGALPGARRGRSVGGASC